MHLYDFPTQTSVDVDKCSQCRLYRSKSVEDLSAGEHRKSRFRSPRNVMSHLDTSHSDGNVSEVGA